MTSMIGSVVLPGQAIPDDVTAVTTTTDGVVPVAWHRDGLFGFRSLTGSYCGALVLTALHGTATVTQVVAPW